MRKQLFIIIVLGVVFGTVLALGISGIFKTASAPATELLQPVKSDRATATDKQIESAQAVIKAKPSDASGYNRLAAAFLQKARETGDFSFNNRAEAALKYSFRTETENFDGLKLQAALLLNYHRFAEALEFANRAQAINSRDHETLGAKVDALVELGDYQNAVDTLQKMVDLRPDTASYSRVSFLRSLHGDPQGAIDAMKMAVGSASPQSPETIAWCRVHLGDEFINSGKPLDAEREYDHALHSFPGYHVALAAKARARYAAGDTDNAVIFYQRAIERVPMPDYIAALGDLYTKLGRAEEANRQYAQVEFIEKAAAAGGTHSRQLALFWADHNIRLDEALEIAQKERAARNDIYAADLLAWCLFKKGNIAEAKTAMDEALRLGTRDPKLLYHAGMINAAAGDAEKGAEYLKQALAGNPAFDILQAEIAKQKLATLQKN